jgi:hypothetical protein
MCGGASSSFEAADTAKPKCMQECLSRKISRLLLLEANAIPLNVEAFARVAPAKLAILPGHDRARLSVLAGEGARDF